MLITDLSTVFTYQSKIDFINHHYQGNDDVLLGVVPDTDEGRIFARNAIAEFLSNNDFSKLNYRIMPRIDQFQDLQSDRYRKSDENYNDFIASLGGSKKYYLTVAVCRRENPIDYIMYDDEVNGATAVQIDTDEAIEIGNLTNLDYKDQ